MADSKVRNPAFNYDVHHVHPLAEKEEQVELRESPKLFVPAHHRTLSNPGLWPTQDAGVLENLDGHRRSGR